MKISSLLFTLLVATGLFGCQTTDLMKKEEVVLPKVQQNTYLAHTIPPQQYGFGLVPAPDGIDFRGTARLHPNHMAQVPFKRGRLPVIAITGSAARKKLNALIDVSSPDSWLEFSTAQMLDADFLGINEMTIPYRGNYNTGNVPAYAAVVRQLRFNQLFIETVPFYVRMALNSLGPLARGIQAPRVDAVLGYGNLRNFEYIQFNFARGHLRLSSNIPYQPREELLMSKAKIIDLPDYGLAVIGAVFGQSTPILLDFAGDYHFARNDTKVKTTRQVSIGDVVLRDVPTLLLPEHQSPPRAGRKILEQYIITVCPNEGVVYFELPPQ